MQDIHVIVSTCETKLYIVRNSANHGSSRLFTPLTTTFDEHNHSQRLQPYMSWSLLSSLIIIEIEIYSWRNFLHWRFLYLHRYGYRHHPLGTSFIRLSDSIDVHCVWKCWMCIRCFTMASDICCYWRCSYSFLPRIVASTIYYDYEWALLTK